MQTDWPTLARISHIHLSFRKISISPVHTTTSSRMIRKCMHYHARALNFSAFTELFFPTFKRHKNIIFVRVHVHLESKVNLKLYKRAKFRELKISFPNTLIILCD